MNCKTCGNKFARYWLKLKDGQCNACRNPEARTYFRGFMVEYTGNREVILGGDFSEVVYLEGPQCGKTAWIKTTA